MRSTKTPQTSRDNERLTIHYIGVSVILVIVAISIHAYLAVYAA